MEVVAATAAAPSRPASVHKRRMGGGGGSRARKGGGGSVVLNVSNCKYDVVRKVAKSFGWALDEEVDEFDATPDNPGPGPAERERLPAWNVMWTDCGVSPLRVMRLKPFQKLNHFPGMHSLARKGALGTNLMALAKLFPTDFRFFPQTFVLPAQWNEFTHEIDSGRGNRTFIIKPDASCQGRGIFLTRGHDNVSSTEPQVAQRYLHKPLLIDGRKFDMRVYFVVTNVDPLRVFAFEEGLVRICAERYAEPKERNFDKACVHLTNYAINKGSAQFVQNESADQDGVGNKRSLTWFWERVDKEHGAGAAQRVKAGINDMVVKSLISVQPFLAHTYRSCVVSSTASSAAADAAAAAAETEDPTRCCSQSSCFEILGFDVLLDRELKPWLIEVNHSPSFTTDSPLDEAIKHKLISKTMGLINVSAGDKRRAAARKKLGAQGRLYRKASSTDAAAAAAAKELAQAEAKAALDSDLQRQARREKESTSDASLQRIYPPTPSSEENADGDGAPTFEHYQPYLSAAKRIFNDKAGGAKAVRRASSARMAVRPAFGSSSASSSLQQQQRTHGASAREKLAQHAAKVEKEEARDRDEQRQRQRQQQQQAEKARAAAERLGPQATTTIITSGSGGGGHSARRWTDKRTERAELPSASTSAANSSWPTKRRPARTMLVKGFDLEKFKQKGMARRHAFDTYLTAGAPKNSTTSVFQLQL